MKGNTRETTRELRFVFGFITRIAVLRIVMLARVGPTYRPETPTSPIRKKTTNTAH